MEIKNWIRTARKKAGLTQEQLAEKLGLTKGNVSAWETGRHHASYAQLQQISAMASLPMPDAESGATGPLNATGRDGQARVQEMLAELGLDAAAVAERAMIPVDSVKLWLAEGGPISIDDAIAIQTAFGYSSIWLLSGKGDKKAAFHYNDEYRPKAIGRRRALAVVGMAQLGDNGFWADIEHAVGHGNGYIDWPTSDPDAYALECAGNSMIPRIKPGEFVIVEPNTPVTPGEEVLVKSKDGRVMVKVFAYKAAGRYHLLSTNEAHGTVSFTDAEIEKMHFVAGIAKRAMWRPD
ncbi:LexA repressor [Caballeronia sordidicola]|uniref:LexA repressor n=1 Tax=Caballeronia sordidicola TaxID=196367 RepID=A0A158G1L8_CABSO|nr:XRE family transcriptional regulator [Caballeronia sordidicola]SAL25965.1 LexA repressor [Caballeronia sordidicola]